jgi:acetyltransferase-like isoleucine patch superfamily enzyme
MIIFIILLKVSRKIGIFLLRLKRFLLINEYRYLSNNRILIESSYLFDINFHIDTDNSDFKICIGKDVFFRDGGRITCYNNGKIAIHDKVFFNRNCSLNSLCNLTIKENCLFGENVKIYDHNHKFTDKEKLIKDQEYNIAPVVIEENCWVGSNVVILKGVTVGKNSIIGANCIIHKDVPPHSLVTADTERQTITKV